MKKNVHEKIHMYLLTWVNSSGNASMARRFGANTRMKTRFCCCISAYRSPVQSLLHEPDFQVSSERRHIALKAVSTWC